MVFTNICAVQNDSRCAASAVTFETHFYARNLISFVAQK